MVDQTTASCNSSCNSSLLETSAETLMRVEDIVGENAQPMQMIWAQGKSGVASSFVPKLRSLLSVGMYLTNQSIICTARTVGCAWWSSQSSYHTAVSKDSASWNKTKSSRKASTLRRPPWAWCWTLSPPIDDRLHQYRQRAQDCYGRC